MDGSGLASLAGQFGFNIPGTGGSESPEFYQELLQSREVLTAVIDHEYQIFRHEDTDTVLLLDLVEIDGETYAERIDRGLEWLREDALKTLAGRETGIVDFSITTRWPDLSHQMATVLLETVQSFNLSNRITQAQAEREFLEERVGAAQGELHQVEGSMQRFLQDNRSWQDSPELIFRHEKLQREVAMRQQVYSGLMEAYEQARIREVRDTPVITIIEHPILPPRREPRGVVLKLLLGGVLGGMIAATLVVIRTGAGVSEDDGVIALREAWKETMSDVKTMFSFGRR